MLLFKTFQHSLNNVLIVRRVYGHSMEPTYQNGRLVIASGLLNVTEGKIVVARHGSREIIKRVSLIRGDTVKLKGDNSSPHHNTVIQASQIRGVVI